MRFAATLGLLLLLAPTARSQVRDELVRGQPVADPEALLGRWAAPDGQGGWLQLEVEIEAMLPLGGSLAAGPFLLERVEVGVCRGSTLALHFGDCNYFSNDSDHGEGTVRMGRGFLTIRASLVDRLPAVEVDLMRDGDGWVGMLRRGGLSAQGRLERRGDRGLSGAWRAGTPPLECLHVAESADGLLASLDQLQDPATMRYANGIQPHPLFELFGRMAKLERDQAGSYRLEIGGADEGSAGAMSRTTQLRTRQILLNGQRKTVLIQDPNGEPRRAEVSWIRMTGESCRTSGERAVDVRGCRVQKGGVTGRAAGCNYSPSAKP